MFNEAELKNVDSWLVIAFESKSFTVRNVKLVNTKQIDI